MTQQLILSLVEAERTKQDKRFGPNNVLTRSFLDGIPVLMEEVGEVARCQIEGLDPIPELIQVAACAVAMIEAEIERRGTIRIVPPKGT